MNKWVKKYEKKLKPGDKEDSGEKVETIKFT